jgi:Flp pilus assembly protein TadD
LDKALGQFEAGLNLPPPAIPAPNWDVAIAGLRQALTDNAKHAEAHNVLGLLLGRNGAKSAEVAAEFHEALRLRPDYAEASNNLGLVLIQAGDDKAGIAALREAVRISPDYAEAHANLGAALTPTDPEEAIQELEKAVALAPAAVNAQFNLAVAYGTSPSRGTAKEIEQLRKVIALAPTLARAHLALGKALLQAGKVADAISELQETAKLDPQNGEAHYQLGLALARAGRRDEAAAQLNKGRELVSADDRNQNANLDVAEGQAAFERGDAEQAIAKFRHALELRPDFSDAQHFLGVALEKQGDTAAASAAYRKAVELNPADVTARQSLDRLTLPDAPTPQKSAESAAASTSGEDDTAHMAELEGYIRESKFEEVEPLLADYVKEHPKSDWGWYALGYSQFAQKKVGESIRSLAQCLQLNVRNAEAHKILGRDLMIIGRFDAAQTEFEQGIRYDPTSAEMYYNLGKLFSMQDDWERARKEFDEALRLAPNYVEALDALGFAQEALGNDAAAVASYEKAIALNDEQHGKYAVAHANLSAYYNRTGNPAKALDYAHKALELDAKSDAAWFQQARAYERQGRLDDAVESLAKAITLNSRASSYYYVLAGIYRRLGKKEESKRALDAFTQLERESNELEKKRRSAAHAATPPGGARD